MHISCPFCGDRSSREFTYRSDAGLARPHADEDFVGYVYLRDNLAGSVTELWYHGQGCRCWLKVRRDTRTHEITGVELAGNPA